MLLHFTGRFTSLTTYTLEPSELSLFDENLRESFRKSTFENYAVDSFKQSLSLETGKLRSLEKLLNKYFDYDVIPKAN